MTPEQRQEVVSLLQEGADLSADWARVLFPPDKREYELVYYGKEREEDILADTMAVPLQPVSSFGKNGHDWRNMLVFGDNLQTMKTLLKMKEEGKLLNGDGTSGIRLIYIDPPFATKREFSGSQDQKAYQDKIVGTQFLEFLRKRLVLMRELLSEDGSIFVHLDWKKCHQIRVLLDEVFGEKRFVNEIIWYYSNKYGANSGKLDSFHNTIYRYSKAKSFVFNAIRVPVKVPRMQPVRAWNSELEKNERLRDEDGNFLNKESKEKDAGDVWEIPVINPVANERLGYPTQKPELLLDWVIRSATNEGDLVLDAFGGSGTTLAVAEKLKRRWIGIDCGKLSIYTIQKRLLSLKAEIGNNGKALPPKAFTLFNAGLYDFSKLKQLPWDDWRFFALQLFGCKDEPHVIGGLSLDGKLRGSSVLVFNHVANPGQSIDEDTIRDIHSAVGNKIGGKFFIVAPRGVFDFQQDFIDYGSVRYYALRIPYSVINELHRRDFSVLQQPSGLADVNGTVDAVGFDFIQPPEVEWSVSLRKKDGELFDQACLAISHFESKARLRGQDTRGGFETLSMVMVDLDYNGEVFDFDEVMYADQLHKDKWLAWLPASVGKQVMAVFIDIYGNEAREVFNTEGIAVSLPDATPVRLPAKKKSKVEK